jgi:hypothetical protein
MWSNIVRAIHTSGDGKLQYKLIMQNIWAAPLLCAHKVSGLNLGQDIGMRYVVVVLGPVMLMQGPPTSLANHHP